MKNRFQILSLDGGGIKGIFSAAILAHLEDDLKTRIINHFDLIVGTSTGGIIALGLGLGLSPKEILHFYVEKGPKIFPGSIYFRIRKILRSKFNSIELEKALRECFGETELGKSKKRLVIPSYNLGDDYIYIFKTPHNKRLKHDYKVPMWKVGMATSAAPTFFPSFRQHDHIRFIDGGIWANNPTMVGIVEAVSNLDVQLNSISVFSLGTTDAVKNHRKKLDNGGLVQWALEATNLIIRSQNIGVHTQSVNLLGKENITRLDPKVPDGLFELDKLSNEELLSKAAHESRYFTPVFEGKFMAHTAQKYEPLYQTDLAKGGQRA